MTTTTTTEDGSALFSETTRRYVLGVLFVTYTFNFIDRQILGILVEPIKQDLGVRLRYPSFREGLTAMLPDYSAG